MITLMLLDMQLVMEYTYHLRHFRVQYVEAWLKHMLFIFKNKMEATNMEKWLLIIDEPIEVHQNFKKQTNSF